MTWTNGPTFPGGPLPEPPPPRVQPTATLASLLPLSRVILAAIRPFPDAYRAVLAALDGLHTLDAVFPPGNLHAGYPLSDAPT